MNTWIKLKDGIERCIESAIERLVAKKFANQIASAEFKFDPSLFVRGAISKIVFDKTNSAQFLAEVDKEIQQGNKRLVGTVHAALQDRVNSRVEELLDKAEMVGLSIPTKDRVIMSSRELREENKKLKDALESMSESFRKIDAECFTLRYQVIGLTKDIISLKKKRSKK